MKTAIVIISDPKGGSEGPSDESLTRLPSHPNVNRRATKWPWSLNGSGTRWPAELTKLSHPANGLYNSVRDAVQGASCGCAEVFGATDSIKSCGVPIVKDHGLAGTAGLLSLRRYIAEGWHTVVF